MQQKMMKYWNYWTTMSINELGKNTTPITIADISILEHMVTCKGKYTKSRVCL